jgi:hypothetical protein
MSRRDYMIMRAIEAVLRLSVPSLLIAASVLAISPTVQAQTLPQILGAADKLSDAASRDVTKLALQVAIVLALVNAATAAAMFRLAIKAVSKPCLMHTKDGHAIMREAARTAMHKPTHDEP